ncbi:MAG: deoxyguanosinetriphosphate triphosphohydrolase [Caulobacteraceae bacterium]
MPPDPQSQLPAPRAAFAANWRASKGRLHPEPESRTRTPFARDRDRIVHTSAFRRLKDKTQVFIAHENDQHRTRLTHSLEVAQIARSLATALGLDADLAETVALAHDLGHPPFAHTGEEELAKRMEAFGGFDHNAHTFRILTELERRYPAFVGLNLTWETLEGVVKHNGPAAEATTRPGWASVAAFDAKFDLELGGWPSAEAQVAALADDIAYNNHDVDDGLAAGLFRLADLEDVPLVGPILVGVRRDWPDVDERMTRLEAVRRMIGAMVDDVLAETALLASQAEVASVDEVRALGRPLVAFSARMNEDLARLRAFLFERMYRHWRVNRARTQARRIVADIFQLYLAEPEAMPEDWGERAAAADEAARARIVCDYVAGMTDRFAVEEHRKLFQLEAWS